MVEDWFVYLALGPTTKSKNESIAAEKPVVSDSYETLTVGREPFLLQTALPRILIAAIHRTKVQSVAAVAERNRKNLGNVHPT